MTESDKILTAEYLDWYTKLIGLPSILTDKIRSKLYKRYKKQTGNEPWQLTEVHESEIINSKPEKGPITFEVRPDPELIIKSSWNSPCPICDGKHGNYGLHGKYIEALSCTLTFVFILSLACIDKINLCDNRFLIYIPDKIPQKSFPSSSIRATLLSKSIIVTVCQIPLLHKDQQDDALSDLICFDTNETFGFIFFVFSVLFANNTKYLLILVLFFPASYRQTRPKNTFALSWSNPVLSGLMTKQI
ncbi:hypothetical protein RclHR1_17070005 [Rhizophagus clarus]|uniref:Uncharacterized protein n=1 Tax=Rhizophagus clarus TaxID=94130 RepID=A0A2Z6RBV6_9GLOM|nr:hypothetical protein RclHR1_17070005 [Rhizophagus clarus]